MIGAIICLLLLTLNPATGNCQPQPMVVATAYCLKGMTTSGLRTTEIHRMLGGCIALSRKLAKDLGLRNGSGRYEFGAIIEVSGVGRFVFADLMPKKWVGYRVDIYFPSLRQCKVFGVKRTQVRRVD